MSSVITNQSILHAVDANGLNSKTINYGYYPFIKGNEAPLFHLHKQDGISNRFTTGSLGNELVFSLEDLLDFQHPLVICFYPLEHSKPANLEGLESLQADVEIMGGKLLVLTNAPVKKFKRRVRQQNKLTIFYDRNNEIAEAFGLYDAENLLWQWVSGVENEEATLPAYYVISPDRQIGFHYIDYGFETYQAENEVTQHPFVRELLTAVYQSARQYAYPSRYKSVS